MALRRDFYYPRKETLPLKLDFHPNSIHPITNVYAGLFINDLYIVVPTVGQALCVPRLEVLVSRPHLLIPDRFQIRPEKIIQTNSRTIVERKKSQKTSLSGK